MLLLSNLEDKEKQIKRLENILFDLKDKEISASKREPKYGFSHLVFYCFKIINLTLKCTGAGGKYLNLLLYLQF